MKPLNGMITDDKVRIRGDNQGVLVFRVVRSCRKGPEFALFGWKRGIIGFAEKRRMALMEDEMDMIGTGFHKCG